MAAGRLLASGRRSGLSEVCLDLPAWHAASGCVVGSHCQRLPDTAGFVHCNEKQNG